MGQGGHGDRNACTGRGCSVCVSSGITRFCYEIRREMLWGSWIRYLTGWFGRRSMIVVVGLQECRNVIDGFIIIVHNICVRCRHVDEIIGINILDILPDYLELEVHCVGCI